jgi:hypothetical protein
LNELHSVAFVAFSAMVNATDMPKQGYEIFKYLTCYATDSYNISTGIIKKDRVATTPLLEMHGVAHATLQAIVNNV